MRSRAILGTKKDFWELTFISLLFLGLVLFSSCSSVETTQAENSAYADSNTASTSPAQWLLLKGASQERN